MKTPGRAHRGKRDWRATHHLRITGQGRVSDPRDGLLRLPLVTHTRGTGVTLGARKEARVTGSERDGRARVDRPIANHTRRAWRSSDEDRGQSAAALIGR
ncbi:hypothetical protein KVA01_24750 [Kocuria varians]|uniref:Uncharacterized protein n=1 Tax=Kocuria varians TaxID=1272 RepID=A0A4Y4DC27_KOCVA|nr:hypothetical protein KVA01_24750 [Kocuria varians]